MSDFMHALVWALGCLAVIFLFRIVFTKGFAIARSKSGVFFTIHLILLVMYFVFAIMVVFKWDDPNFGWAMYAMIITTVINLIWIGAWSAGAKMDREEGLN